MGRYISGLPNKRELSNGRVIAAVGTDFVIVLYDIDCFAGTGQPDREAAPVLRRIVGTRQYVTPRVFAESHLAPSRNISIPAERARKDFDVPSLGSTGEGASRMRTRKARKVAVAIFACVFGWWIRITLGTNVVTVSLVAIAACNSNHLKIANWAFDGIINFVFGFGTKCALAGHHMTLLT